MRAAQQAETLRQDLVIAHAARSDAEARAAAALATIAESDQVARDAISQADAARKLCEAAEQRAADAEARAAAAEERVVDAAAARAQAEAQQDAWHRAAGDAAQLAEAAVAEVAAVRADTSTSANQQTGRHAEGRDAQYAHTLLHVRPPPYALLCT